MPSFARTFWNRFLEFKEAPAVHTLEDHRRCTDTFWQWTRRVQNLAMALLDAEFQPGTRMGFVAPNCRQWFDMAWATWLVGGCVVPVNSDIDRQKALRCLSRSGCDWIAVADDDGRRWLRGPGGELPSHLQWVVFDGETDDEKTHLLEKMQRRGRHLVQRGKNKKIAELIYELSPQAPALILFDPQPDQNAEGALFSGRKVDLQLQRIAHQMGLVDSQEVAVTPAMPFGWFSSFLMCAAALYDGHCVALPTPGEPMDAQLTHLQPTHLVCNREYLRELARHWKQRIDAAPDILRRLADTDASDAPAVSRALGKLGEKAARKLLYDPIRDDFGGRLEAIYLFEGRCPVGLDPILQGAGIDLLGHFGLPETAITHVEHPGATRKDSCGRPIEGIATRLPETKTGDTGELCIRGDTIFDEYWAGEGPRSLDDDGWVHTGRDARIESGFLFLEDVPGSEDTEAVER